MHTHTSHTHHTHSCYAHTHTHIHTHNHTRTGKQTVLIIAHRLEDIAMCDQVAAIREGRIDEYGPPLALLENPNGAFSTLVNELGDEGAARVRELALEASCLGEGGGGVG